MQVDGDWNTEPETFALKYNTVAETSSTIFLQPNAMTFEVLLSSLRARAFRVLVHLLVSARASGIISACLFSLVRGFVFTHLFTTLYL